MTAEAIRAFARQVDDNAALGQELGRRLEALPAGADMAEATLGLARDKGFDVTAAEVRTLLAAISRSDQGELSEADLDSIAGGGFFDDVFVKPANTVGNAATTGWNSVKNFFS
ncbi:MAG: hypothetical protein ACK4ZN_02395 [Oceanibaculum sp.]